MSHQPISAGSAERDLIESMLDRQQHVLTELDELFHRIEGVIGEISDQRKAEQASELNQAEIETEGQTVPFESTSENLAPAKRAA